MTINTKFNVNDEVWLMHDNRPISLRVREINTHAAEMPCNGKQQTLVGVFYEFTYGVGGALNISLRERDVFGTKEELIASL